MFQPSKMSRRAKISAASLLCAFLFLTSNGCKAEDASAASKNAETTKRELGERKTFKCDAFAFSMRPPVGYELQTEKGENATTFGWAAKRKDGSKSGVLVQAIHVPAAQEAKISEQIVLAKCLAESGDPQNKISAQEGTKEIEGRKFATADFQRELPNGSKVVGYIYVTKVDKNNFCLMMAQDYPANKDDLDFVRSAHETFKVE